MDQELKRNTLVASAGGVMKAVQLDALVPAICDFTYRTDDPLVVELTITTFLETARGAHSEFTTWEVGRDLIRQAFASHQPVGEGDIAIAYHHQHDQLVIVFTDGSERNPDGLRATHRLQLDAEPVATFIQHCYLQVPQADVDVDAFIAEVLEAGQLRFGITPATTATPNSALNPRWCQHSTSLAPVATLPGPRSSCG